MTARATTVKHPMDDYRTSQEAPLAVELNTPFDNSLYEESHIDDATAEKIAARCLELGADHAFTRPGRSPTPADRTTMGHVWFEQGKITADRPLDMNELRFVYLKGAVEEAFEEFGADPRFDKDRHKVDAFLKPLREAAAEADRAAREITWNTAVDAFFTAHPQNPAIERAIREAAKFGKRGACLPEIRDSYGWFSDAVAKTHDQYHKPLPAYEPEQSGFVLGLRTCICINHTQESYADQSVSVFPLIVQGKPDAEAAQRNLSKLALRLNTHTGFAGSGSTYTLAIVVEEDGAFVRMSGRHSISD